MKKAINLDKSHTNYISNYPLGNMLNSNPKISNQTWVGQISAFSPVIKLNKSDYHLS